MPRHPAPTHLKILRGDREDRVNRGEPTPSDQDIVAPAYLSDSALEVWHRLVPDLVAKRVMTWWDADLMGAYCDAIATYQAIRAEIGNNYVCKGSVPGTVVKNALWRVALDALDVASRIGARFGLTPSDRAKLDVTEIEPKPTTGPERLLS